MKTNYKLVVGGILIATSIFTISACKKFLTVEPISSFGNDYVFNTVTNATKAVLGVYSSLGGDAGYGIRLSMYYPYDNDEMMGQGGTPYPDNERRDIAHFNVQPANTQLANPFNQIFTGIERANLCIDNIPKMDGYSNGSTAEQKELKRLYGEALTLRAQFYFEAMRNWGDLPAQFTSSVNIPDPYLPRTDRDIIYDQIIKDLAIAAPLVPWRTEAAVTADRISQGAVRALRARFAMFRAGYSLRQDKTMKRNADYLKYYQIAKDECSIIMARTDHKLNPSFESVFKDGVNAHKFEPNGEVIWEVGMTGGSSQVGDSKLGYYNGPRQFTAATPATTAVGNAALTILPTYFYAFDANDKRRDVTCAPYDINLDMTLRPRTLVTMLDGKFRRDWQVPAVTTSASQYFGVNWPIIRFSDVLLMFAEADNEISGAPSLAAKSAFEQVRTRGFGGNATLIGITPSDYAGFFAAIVKERQFEFGGEGIRKYDLIRWNLLASKLAETKANLALFNAGAAPYNNVPARMYYTPNQPTMVWLNSFYAPSAASGPTGSAFVVWRANTIATTISTYYAIAFTPNKSELLPLPQSVIDANPKLGGQWYGY
jgi:hypothetical protein